MNVPALLRKPRRLYTLVFLMKEEKILLGLKKRGVGTGKWNGFGGKVESGETIIEAAAREVKEECGLTAKLEDLKFLGVNHFEFTTDPVVFEVHVFKCTKFEGELQESEEMLPKWYPISDLPKEYMWADNEIWLPLVYNETHLFRGYYLVEISSETILKHSAVDLEEPSSSETILKHSIVNLVEPSKVICQSDNFDGVE